MGAESDGESAAPIASGTNLSCSAIRSGIHVSRHRCPFTLHGAWRLSLDRSIRSNKALGLRQALRHRTSLGEFVLLAHPLRHFMIELNQYRPGSPNQLGARVKLYPVMVMEELKRGIDEWKADAMH